MGFISKFFVVCALICFSGCHLVKDKMDRKIEDSKGKFSKKADAIKSKASGKVDAIKSKASNKAKCYKNAKSLAEKKKC